MGLKQVTRKISVTDPTDPAKKRKLEGDYLAWECEIVNDKPSPVSPDDLILAASGVWDYAIVQRGRVKEGETRSEKGVVNHFLDGINGHLYREALAILIPEDPFKEIRKNAGNLVKLGVFQTEDEAFNFLKAKLDAKS